ncbi:MAG TPA: c-type cytochrome biogenesis protein CcmI [Xanthobacteraceae bacterium]|nr:c-type cytochrome biogenesis protein CcmI [Xanthobacteraceae bacterium]
MIWVLMLLMTAVAVMAVLWPLSRRGADARKEAREPSDVAVYTDQLDEIERDQRFGLIAPAEADAARIEVSRRLIAAADAATEAAKQKPAAAASPTPRRVVALIALIALPAVALGVYLAIGSPGLPGAPLAQRIAQAHTDKNPSVAELFARMERHLEQHPEDGRGWELVAPLYMQLGRFDDAIKARRNALDTLGATAERWSALGEAMVARENGIVTGDAKAAFDSALKIDPRDITARFYSGLAAEQDGRSADAAAIWRALAADAPPNAPWLPAVRNALARVDPAAASALANAPAAPPNDMIAAMVARLDARLHQDGSDVDGWIMLVRSYTMLHQPDKAKATEDEARKALANDPDKLARLEAGLKAIAAGAPPPASERPAASSAPPASAANGQNSPANEQNAPNEMIRNMVARLDARLHQDGSDVDGWIKLVRSYLVLGEPDKARATLSDARNALKGDPDKLRQLDEGAKNLGMGGS